jgi:predicted ATPase/DNA-binding CsgD family transcriptional regulator
MAQRLDRAGVTDREAEVLYAVAERLRNREIAERFHVSVRTVESHVAALLRSLGVSDRAALAEIGVELRRSTHADIALPVPLTSLIGRDTETAELATLLASHRLVTLLGPGGVGKTRLALHVAAHHSDRFPHGARLADLAPVHAPLVGDTIARALGVVPSPGWSLRDVLREVARGMHCLLLVDNCEHVAGEAAEIVAELLTAGSQLRVLATSREPLGVPGEVTYQVQPLPVPRPGEASRAGTAASFAAVRLFVERASAAEPGFVLVDADTPDVVALCQRLDGLPLAIELAASRVRSFGPNQLVTHLDRRFELLSTGARTVAPRHRTLRAAIDWSYELLDDDERVLFDRLGVFPADFDLPAAEAVHADGGAAVISVLPRLVDKSLVSTSGRDTRRYRLLETIRSYAAERLDSGGAAAVTRDRHAAHYLTLAEHAARQLRTADQRTALRRLTIEQPNVRAALARSVDIGDVRTGWRWIAALQRFWDVTGQRVEATTWIQRVRAAGAPPATPEVVAGLSAASSILQASDARAAFELARQATRLAADLDDASRGRAARALGMAATWIEPELVLPSLHEALAWFDENHRWERALTMQGLAQTTGELPEALRWGRASVILFRAVGDDMHAANALFIMAQRAIYAGLADDEVHGWLAESRALADATGSEEDRTHATVGFAQLAWARGDHDGAADLMRECLPTLRRLGDQRCTGRALYILGTRAYQQEQLARAEELLTASVQAIVLAGQSFVLVNALEALAAVHTAQGHHRHAAVLLGTAQAARTAGQAHMRPLQSPDTHLRESVEHALGAAAFTAAHADGEAMAPIQAIQPPTPGENDLVP